MGAHGGERSREVAVVGASASGLFTSLLLARAGLRVTLYERTDSLSPAPRTLIVTGAIQKYLGTLGNSSVNSRISRYELYANGKVGEINLGRVDLIIERARLIEELAREAVIAGVDLRFGYRFLGFETGTRTPAPLVERSDQVESIRAGVVVGADGATSAVARASGWHRQPTVPLLQAIVQRPKDLPPDTARVWFVPRDTPYFYWLIPDGPERAALGIIGERPRGLRERFLEFLSQQDLEPVEYQGARIPCYARWTRVHRRVGSTDVYLVGDAAGQVKVSTVGGLVTGFRGAIGVAEAITGGQSRQTLRRLKRELDAHRLVRRIVHRFGEHEYCRVLELLNDATRKSLNQHTRDEATSILWRVALGQPRFWPLSIKALLDRSS